MVDQARIASSTIKVSPVAEYSGLYLGTHFLTHLTDPNQSAISHLHSLKLSARSRNFYSLITNNGHHIFIGVSKQDRFNARFFSVAIATDPNRGTMNALNFSESLYDPDDVFNAVVQRAGTGHTAPHQSILPFQHNERFKLDYYGPFLRDFQRGIQLVELVRIARLLADTRYEKTLLSRGILPELQRRIAGHLFECCRETFTATGSLLGNITAKGFLGHLRMAGLADEAILAIADFIAASSGENPQQVVVDDIKNQKGFGKYVARAIKTCTVGELRSALLPLYPREKTSGPWESGLLDPIVVASN